MTAGSADRPSSSDPVAAWNALLTSAGGLGASPAASFLGSVQATAAGVAERRTQIQALVAQLNLFDDQLAAFQASLQPMIEWTQAWVRIQEQALDPFGLTRRKSP